MANKLIIFTNVIFVMGDAMNKTCLSKIFNNKLARFVTEMSVILSDL